MKLPRDIGPIHFVGIGGIGMSGIAEVLANLGYTVQGSDVADSANVKRLRDKGVKVAIGHAAENLDERRGRRRLVRDQARQSRNWWRRARTRLPVVRRAEMLAELMRLKRCVAIAGTHGKTTTTSMVATLLDAGGFDPTVINGGIINAYGTNARLGAGDWMVVEADESDGTFLKLPADVAIVTNIDPEHLDHFKTFDAVKDAFRDLRRERAVLRLRGDVHRPSGGAGAGRPHRGPPHHHLWREPAGRRRAWSISTTPTGGSRFSVVFRDRAGETAHAIAGPRRCRCRAATTRSTPRRRSRSRTSSALRTTQIRKALAGFGGVKRRFTRTGDWNGVTDHRRLRPPSGRDRGGAARPRASRPKGR